MKNLAYRHEYKFVINLSDTIEMKKRLACCMEKDPHALSDGSYFVKSLYFDNLYDKALKEKIDGVNPREKFRIRVYNNDDSFIRLE
ncbi:MAG TPA: VTC domain-containing protein, partial [Thermotogota bacterium]|nr:VTC domain-containing protein [Thermotogota bacterium]